MAKNHIPFIERAVNLFRERVQIVRRAFAEFLAYPTLIIFAFVLLAAGVYVFERSQFQITSPVYSFFKERVFASADATSDLLSNIAGSIITVTSITITLLLLIVQQTATNMTSLVFDQFLRRRSNQFYFGYFVGVAVYSLLILATVREPFNPVLGALLVFAFTIIAMFMLMVLFYSTIHQMRPNVILAAIHGHTLAARRNQQDFIRRTRRKSKQEAPLRCEVRANYHGFVTAIQLDALNGIIEEAEQVREIVLVVSIGSFVAYQDRIAELMVTDLEGTEALFGRVRGAIQMESMRDLASDPGYGIKQLETIGWTVLSPSKSNLASGLQAIYNLRDILARWADESWQVVTEEPLPVVYNDNVLGELIHAFESLAVMAAVSQEHQVITDIFISFASLYDRLPGQWQLEVEDSIVRLLPTLQDYHMTASFERALRDLGEVFEKTGRQAMANRVKRAYSRAKNGNEDAGDQ